MEFSSGVLSFLASITVRSLGLAVLALIAVLVGRIRSAAAVHAVCTAVVAGMLALAVLSPVLPPLPVRVLQEVVPAPDLPMPLPLATTVGKAQPLPPVTATPQGLSWEQIAVAVYGAGVLAFLVRLAFGYLFTRRLFRASRAIDRPWASEVYESSWISVPLTVGWLRPRILLPVGWDAWSEAKLQAVLAHEGTHVQRGDWAISVLAGLNRCIFWFHPLAWWLERRLAFLAEQACDDRALLLVGTEPYAEALLDMAAAVRAGQGRLVWEAMAMANVAEIRHRIERILDETRQIPKGLTRSRWAVLIACSLPLIYVASVIQLAPAQVQQQEVAPRKGTMVQTPSPMSELLKGKKQLGPGDAALMEQHLATNPQDLDVRAQLVVYYFSAGIREPRLSHIFWLIANHPESTQAVFTSRGITARTTAMNEASDYTRAAGLWKQQAASHANDPRVLANAAEFLSQPGGDVEEAERLLIQARKVQPGNEWTIRLARLYTVAIVGSAGDSRYPDLNSSFAGRAKLQLENSTDGALLQITGRMLAAVAVRPQPGQKLPEGVMNLDEHAMLTPVVEMGNRLIARSQQYLDGAPGILGYASGYAPSSWPPGQTFQSSIDSASAQPLAPALSAAPVLITRVDPVYPPLARQARISGVVSLMLQIGTDGRVQHVQLMSGHPLLAPAALDAVKQWVYAPIAAAGTIHVSVPFWMDGGDAPLSSPIPGQVMQQQMNGVLGGVPGGVVGGIVGGVPPPPPQPAAPGTMSPPARIRIGGAVQAAKLMSKVDPVYPEQARAAGIEGTVQLDVIIGEDGRVESVAVRDGHPLLATAAVEAVRQWVYQPTHLNGVAVSVSTTVTVPFTLQ